MMRVTAPSADLYMRSAASPDAPETNITARITAGSTYDVKDVDVSPDGTKVAFAMRGPGHCEHESGEGPLVADLRVHDRDQYAGADDRPCRRTRPPTP